MTNGTETFYRIDVPPEVLGLSCRVSVHVCSMTVNSWEDFSFHGFASIASFVECHLVLSWHCTFAAWLGGYVSRKPQPSRKERMVETIGLSVVERVCVVSTTLVGVGACCIVDKGEPPAQRRPTHTRSNT